MFCAQCGQSVAQADRFCASCGQSILQSAPGPVAASAGALPYGGPPQGPPTFFGVQPPTPNYAVGAVRGDLDPVTGQPLAGWGKRVGAYLLDGVIVGVPLGVIWIIVIAASNQRTGQIACTDTFTCHYVTVFHPATFWPASIAIWLVAVLYYVILIGRSRGQTLGMMAIGIAVRDSSNADQSIGFGRALLRYIVMFLLGLPFGIPLLVDLLSPLWDSRQQAWHDHAATSMVVAVR